MNLTLFDLDHTLLPFDSDYEWGAFLVRLGVQDELIFAKKNAEFYEHYKAGTLDIHAYVNFLTAALRQHPRAEIEDWHSRYMREVVTPQIHPSALQLVAQHRADGDLCAIVTATNSFVVGPIAQRFGIEHLIATELEQTPNGQFTGRIAGTPSFREGKIVRVEQWLQAQGCRWQDFARSTFYSDSINDLPLLEKVSDPVATNADTRLLKHAQKNNWRVISLFD
ncbi:MAG: HAD family hydrolase [Burkholderiaceae bacterium]|nr:MAG: HAD family hydrolase [Burkholderiaceae bacterium]